MLKGETLVPLSAFYNYHYPPTKFLKIYQSKICIKCILCGFPRTGLIEYVMLSKKVQEKSLTICILISLLT